MTTSCDRCFATTPLLTAYNCPECDCWLCGDCWMAHPCHGQIDGQQELVPDPRTTTDVPS